MSNGPTFIAHDDTPPGGKYYVKVPGHLAPIQQFDLPTGVTGAARLAVARQQLTDRLGGSAGDVSVIPIGGGQWTTAIVCDTQQLSSWTSTDAARARRCLGVVPDMLTLPCAEKTLVLAQHNGTIIARGGAHDGFTAPLAFAVPLLQRLISDNALTSWHPIGDVPAEVLAAVEPLARSKQALVPPKPPVDMRLGAVKPGGSAAWVWMAAAVLGFVAFGLWAGSIWIETRALREDAAQIRAATIQLLRDGPIPSAPILDIRQQVEQALSQQANGRPDTQGTAVELLSRASVALFGTGTQINAITYDGATQGLQIDVAADTFADVDELRASFETNLLTANASDMRNVSGGGVSARLDVRFAEATP